MISKQQFVDTSREYLGTKFHHQGRVKGVGVDCVGLLVCGLRDTLHREIPDVVAYSLRPDGVVLKDILDKNLTKIEFTDLTIGDIILFNFDSVAPQHVAIVSNVNPLYILHAYSVARKVTEHVLDSTWKNRVVQCYSVPWLEV